MQDAQVPNVHDQVDAELAARLRKARGELDKTQQEMADFIGAGLSTWQSYERGTSPPKIQVLTKLVNAGFSAVWLLTGEGRARSHQAEPAGAESSHVDKRLLKEILEALETELDQRQLSLAPEKKGAAVAHLYDYFLRIGHIDKESLNTVLQLVA